MGPRALWVAAPFAVLALAVASFTMTPLWIQRQASALREPAAMALTSSVRSLDSLIDMRAQLHLIMMANRPDGDHAQVAIARRRLWSDLTAYTASRPVAPATLETAVHALLDAPDATEPKLLRQASERLTSVLMDELAAEQRRASAAATTLEQIRARALRLSHELTIAWAALALLGGAIAAWLVRRDLRLSGAVRRLERERANELERFSERVAHDILSPLAAVSAGAHVLSRKLREDPAAQRTAHSVRSSLERVGAIVEELLRFARAGARPASGERADLARVVASLREEMLPAARERGVALTVDAPPPVQVACAEAAIHIVLQNLVRNAIKYIGDGPRKVVRAWATVEPGKVRLVVEDTGPGIPPGMEQRVFEPYVRAGRERGNVPGVGLGLATVKRLVESRQGTVGVSSQPSRGATFWVELPIAPDPALH